MVPHFQIEMLANLGEVLFSLFLNESLGFRVRRFLFEHLLGLGFVEDLRQELSHQFVKFLCGNCLGFPPETIEVLGQSIVLVAVPPFSELFFRFGQSFTRRLEFF